MITEKDIRKLESLDFEIKNDPINSETGRVHVEYPGTEKQFRALVPDNWFIEDTKGTTGNTIEMLTPKRIYTDEQP